jgi:hypothetical protein
MAEKCAISAGSTEADAEDVFSDAAVMVGLSSFCHFAVRSTVYTWP